MTQNKEEQTSKIYSSLACVLLTRITTTEIDCNVEKCRNIFHILYWGQRKIYKMASCLVISPKDFWRNRMHFTFIYWRKVTRGTVIFLWGWDVQLFWSAFLKAPEVVFRPKKGFFISIFWRSLGVFARSKQTYFSTL